MEAAVGSITQPLPAELTRHPQCQPCRRRPLCPPPSGPGSQRGRGGGLRLVPSGWAQPQAQGSLRGAPRQKPGCRDQSRPRVGRPPSRRSRVSVPCLAGPPADMGQGRRSTAAGALGPGTGPCLTGVGSGGTRAGRRLSKGGSGERVCGEECRRQKEQPARGPEGTSLCWSRRPVRLGWAWVPWGLRGSWASPQRASLAQLRTPSGMF